MAMCIFQNCTSVQKPFCSLAFFSLPKDYRRRLWIENSGNSELANLSETARRVVCQKHFSPGSLRIQFHRTTLSRDAVPERWDAERLTSSLDSSVVEPIEYEIADVDDIVDDPPSHVSRCLQTPNEDADANDFENDPVYEAEGIELVEIDSEENSQNEDYVIENILSNKIDQQDNDDEIIVLEEPSHESPTFVRPAKIQKADVRINSAPGVHDDTSASVKIVQQCSNKSPNDLMQLNDNDSVRHYSDIIVSSSTSSQPTHNPSASAHITNEEDKYFALALAGILQRISPQKKAYAKVNILRYLTELEYGGEARIN